MENKICSTTWVDPKTVFEPYPDPKNSPLGPQKVKNDPKFESKSNVRIEGNIENESCSNTRVDPKTVFKPYPNPKNSPIGSQKIKMTPNSSQNQKLELKRTLKKVVQLHEYNPNEFLSPTSIPEISH